MGRRGAVPRRAFDKLYDRLPKEFIFEREMLRSRLWRSPDRWELEADNVVPTA